MGLLKEGMKTSGWRCRYSCREVVPHFGAPTMKKFGLALSPDWRNEARFLEAP